MTYFVCSIPVQLLSLWKIRCKKTDTFSTVYECFPHGNNKHKLFSFKKIIQDNVSPTLIHLFPRRYLFFILSPSWNSFILAAKIWKRTRAHFRTRARAPIAFPRALRGRSPTSCYLTLNSEGKNVNLPLPFEGNKSLFCHFTVNFLWPSYLYWTRVFTTVNR